MANNKIEKIRSSLFKPGTKFIVTPEIKCKNMSAGSCGFVSYIRGSFKKHPYMATLDVVITRRGKQGKNRVSAAVIDVPIFFAKDLEIPKDKGNMCVAIDRMPLTHKNLINLSALDFIAWGFAIVRFLERLTSKAPNYIWPETKNVPLNVLYDMEERFNNDPAHTLESLGDKAFREVAIADIRAVESSLVKCYMEYFKKAADFEFKGIDKLHFINNEKGGKLIDNALLAEARKFYANRRDRLNNLSKGAGKFEPDDILSNVFLKRKKKS
jgi:hypothetical protein